MGFRRLLRLIAAAAMICAAGTALAQEPIRLRIASGQKPTATYIYLMQSFFVPELVKRVSERTQHKLVVEEGYSGSIVGPAETLEHVQSGDIDIGAYCFVTSLRICRCIRFR